MSLFNVVIGSYETPLYGFEGGIRIKGSGEATEAVLALREVFAYAAHIGCIKSVASCGKWLASSSTDEAVKVYDLKRRKEIGTLTSGEGVATCLEFFQKTHLFAGTDKGLISIWDTKEWEPLKTLKGHKDRVNSLAIHPSGVLALSVSRDKTLRLWNLTKGICAHTIKLGYEAELVRWSPDGEFYVIVESNNIHVHSKTGDSQHTFSEKKKILAACFLMDNVLATGGEDHTLNIWNLAEGTLMFSMGGYTNRLKSIGCVDKKELMPKGTELPEDASPLPYIITISSDEYLRIWDLDISTEQAIVQKRMDARLTCLTVSTRPNKSGADPFAAPVANAEANSKKSKKQLLYEKMAKAAAASGRKQKKGAIPPLYEMGGSAESYDEDADEDFDEATMLAAEEEDDDDNDDDDADLSGLDEEDEEDDDQYDLSGLDSDLIDGEDSDEDGEGMEMDDEEDDEPIPASTKKQGKHPQVKINSVSKPGNKQPLPASAKPLKSILKKGGDTPKTAEKPQTKLAKVPEKAAVAKSTKPAAAAPKAQNPRRVVMTHTPQALSGPDFAKQKGDRMSKEVLKKKRKRAEETNGGRTGGPTKAPAKKMMKK